MPQYAPQQDELPADPTAPKVRVWPILLAMFVLNVFAYAAIVGALQVLLPTQVRLIAGDGAPSALALVTGIAAISSFAVPPFVGILSDRTRSRWGRRAPWIFFGGLGTAGTLLMLGLSGTVAWLVVGWFLMQAMVNIGLNVILATIPDRIPAHRHGLASTVQGLGMPVGAILGVQIGAYFVDAIFTGYLLLAILVPLASLVSAWLTREARGVAAEVRERRPVLAELRQTFASLRFRDYRWVFISRTVLYLGFAMVSSFNLYAMQDYIKLPPGMTAAEAVAISSSFLLPLTVVGTAVAGPLVDRFKHHRMFVLGSGLASAAAMLIPFVWPVWTASLISGAISGLAMGLYLGVDLALATLVMPADGDTGRDLGVFHIALTAPQVVAPFLAAMIVSSLGGYSPLYLISGVISLIGALAVLRVRSNATAAAIDGAPGLLRPDAT
ncbi:MFS transporter [Sinosporangium siamense]|uniref:MFS transporter n=1 Tax=Sinosporangium siamense TaxID=1367973 RepID=A0A919RLN3_9ACTN|nr:MFS transporter [Sinosporangium siamense]GII95105.1 MFS transporter [Sinosporangium siamense]